jgi:hypothetical protein
MYCRRHHHAADGGHHRQGGAPRRRKLAMHQLAFDLQSNDEKEDDHQAVIHKMSKGIVDRDDTQVEFDRTPPDVEIRILPGGVGPDECDDCGGDDDDAAGGLRPHEMHDGTDKVSLDEFAAPVQAHSGPEKAYVLHNAPC